MSTEIKLYQVAQRVHVVALKKAEWRQNGSLIQVVKKHGGRWNATIGQFHIPSQNVIAFIKDVKCLDERLIIKDFASVQLRRLLSYSHQDRQGNSMNHKWTRVLVFDPLLMRRFQFISNFISSGGKVTSTSRESYKKVLFIYSERMVKCWTEAFRQAKINFKDADYRSMAKQENFRISKLPLQENEVDLLSYEQLQDYSINKKVLQKFTSIICDDSDIWINNDNGLLSSYDIGTQTREILSHCHGLNLDLIFIVAKLPIIKPALIFQICNILRPWQYGRALTSDPKSERPYNDATWIKKNKYSRELLYILESTLLVNLSPTNSKEAIMERKINHDFEPYVVERIGSIDSRFKNINRKAAVNSIQAERSKIPANVSNKAEELKYIKELRETAILGKLPYLTKNLYHIVKELKQRVVLVVQNQQIFDKIAKFLVEQEIPYLIYEINMEEMKKGISYKYNNSDSPRLCILVRDRLLIEYKKCIIDCEKESEKELIAQGLGLESEQLFEFTWYKRRRHTQEYKKEESIELPKINTAQQIIFFDTFWYDFSEEKEDIIANIFNSPQIFNTNIQEKENTEKANTIEEYRNINMVKNYYICSDSFEKAIFQRYEANYNSYKNEEKQEQEDEQELSLEEFTKNLLEKHAKMSEGRPVIEQVYDIDDQFDKYEFEAMKEKEKMDEEDSGPVYVTQIKDEYIQTPCILELEAQLKEKQLQEVVENVVELPQPQPTQNQVQWLQNNNLKQEDDLEYESESDSQISGSINLKEYIERKRVNQQKSDEYLKKLTDIEKMKAEIQKLQKQDSDDSFDSSICLEIKEKEDEISMEKEIAPKRQKLHIQEPTEVIEIDDNDDYSPLNIVKFQSSNQKSYQPIPSYRSSHHSINRFSTTNHAHSKSKGKTTSTPGLQLWGSKGHVTKVIARKYMNLKIKLTPNKSFYSNRPE